MLPNTNPTCMARALSAAAGLAAILLTAGCAPPTPAPPAPEELAPDPVEEVPAFAIDSFDFGNTDWAFVPFTESYPPVNVTLQDGTAELDGTTYTVFADEVILSDADGDGDHDALVPIEAFAGGNVVDRQWYLWATHDDSAVQVELPVARTLNCSTFTEKVTAVEGGFEIHEFRRGIGEDQLACTERGTDERTRTVGISDRGPDGALWPIQIAPLTGYGGVCPVTAEYDAYPVQVDLYTAPDAGSEVLEQAGHYEWGLGQWPIYTETYPDWLLIGVKNDAGLGCAWAKRG